MPQSVTIESLPAAFRMMKAMRAQGVEWSEDYRSAAGAPLKDILEARMDDLIACRLDDMARREIADRRNGRYRRGLMTELGEIELAVPRTRAFSALEAVRAYARRGAHIDPMVLACFVLGLSTRKVATALVPILGRRISAGTVSRVAKTQDGAGALRKPVLVALGIRSDGRKEILDFRLAAGESAVEWERFLTDLYRRGLTGAGIETICADGGQGLIAALPTVYTGIPFQRCCLTRTRSGGPQDRERPRRGWQARPRRRQGQPPRRHERRQPAQGAQRRAGLRRRLPAQRPFGWLRAGSRRTAHLLPLQNPRRAHAGQNHQRHRTALPGSPATDAWRRGHLGEQ